jgi:hypothetical protein
MRATGPKESFMSNRLTFRLPMALLLLGGALAMSPSFAAPALSKADMLARYQGERAKCNKGETLQSRHDCLYEAESAYRDAKLGRLDVSGVPYAENQQMRCDVHKSAEARSACEARMQGEGTISGSAATGGIFRELTMRQVGDEKPVPVEAPR